MFEVIDLAGLDTVLAVMRQIQPDLAVAREPSAIIRDHLGRGELGANTGQGFYTWTPAEIAAVRQRKRGTLVTLPTAEEPARTDQD